MLAVVARVASLVAACALSCAGLCAGCDRAIATSTRTVLVHAPSCGSAETYARPLVVRLDRERALFDEPWTTEARVDTPPKGPVAIVVPRTRMKIRVRIGACLATSLGTWDCAAASWLGSASADLDARSSPVEITAPKADVGCVRAK